MSWNKCYIELLVGTPDNVRDHRMDESNEKKKGDLVTIFLVVMMIGNPVAALFSLLNNKLLFRAPVLFIFQQ
jgi:hypothetical protein